MRQYCRNHKCKQAYLKLKRKKNAYSRNKTVYNTCVQTGVKNCCVNGRVKVVRVLVVLRVGGSDGLNGSRANDLLPPRFTSKLDVARSHDLNGRMKCPCGSISHECGRNS